MTISLHATASRAPVALSKIGPYLLGRVLGRGKSGITYEAAHLTQGRRVALKLMDRQVLTHGPISRQNALFAREAMILAKLPRHEGVIGVLDAGVAEGLPYIVTDLVDGQPLSEWMRLRRTEIREQVRILRDVALAVHHAHQNDVLHRNLKPSNVLVDAVGRAYVTDFGSAKRTGTDHAQSSVLFRGDIVGTPSYTSPEQAGGKSVDRRSDVYSLGAILYEILTGAPPFGGGSSMTDLIRVIRGEIVPPSEASADWACWEGDKSIEQACMSALSKSPEGRLPTALALAEALTAWLGQPEARPVPNRKRWFQALFGVGPATVAALFALLRGHE